MREFTLDELSKGNGADGNPVYVAHEERVFDVSASKLWKDGLHMKRHRAGTDLTTAIQAAPHTPEMLERFPQVGIVKQGPDLERPLSKGLATLLKHFPILRRHPHPMVVHFPIAFMFSSTVFTVLYLIFSIESFQTTAWHCLGGGILFTPLAMITGWFTWWLNYLSKPMKPVTIKIWCSLVLFLLQVIAFGWKALVPGILDSISCASILYCATIISFVPLVIVIGWFGATMTFPVEKR